MLEIRNPKLEIQTETELRVSDFVLRSFRLVVDDELFRIQQRPEHISHAGEWCLGLLNEVQSCGHLGVAGVATDRAEVGFFDDRLQTLIGKTGTAGFASAVSLGFSAGGAGGSLA